MFQVALLLYCSILNVLFPAVKNKFFIKEYDLHFLFDKKDSIFVEGNLLIQREIQLLRKIAAYQLIDKMKQLSIHELLNFHNTWNTPKKSISNLQLLQSSAACVLRITYIEWLPNINKSLECHLHIIIIKKTWILNI